MISNFAETLRKLRTDRKMSQQFLANQIHVNRTTVSKWEAGTRIPDAAMIGYAAEEEDKSIIIEG